MGGHQHNGHELSKLWNSEGQGAARRGCSPRVRKSRIMNKRLNNATNATSSQLHGPCPGTATWWWIKWKRASER